MPIKNIFEAIQREKANIENLSVDELKLAMAEDPDLLLAMAGKVSSDLQEIVRNRPKLFADLIRQLKGAPDHAILRIVREVRDGDW